MPVLPSESSCFEQVLISELDAVKLRLQDAYEKFTRNSELQTKTCDHNLSSIPLSTQRHDVLAEERSQVSLRPDPLHRSPLEGVASARNSTTASSNRPSESFWQSRREKIQRSLSDLGLGHGHKRRRSAEVISHIIHIEDGAQLDKRFWCIHIAQYIVSSPWFDLLSGCIVLTQSALLGYDIELEATNADDATMRQAKTVGNILVIMTGVELFIRLLSDGFRYNRGWNFFDFILLSLACLDMLFAATFEGSKQFLRLLRISKMMRMLRMGRILQYAQSFVKMAYCIAHSLPTFFPAFVLIITFVYVCSMILTQVTIDHLRDQDGVYDSFIEDEVPEGHTITLRKAYGRVPNTIYSLGKSISGGQSWGELLLPLTELHWLLPTIFVIFVSFNLLCIMNVVASVFVENAIECTKHFKELLLEQQKQGKALMLKHLHAIFMEIDDDQSGIITQEEIAEFMKTESGQAFFDVVGLGVADAVTLVTLLDTDCSGAVTIDEFCDGCLTFQGEATSFHMHCLMKESSLNCDRINSLCSLGRRLEQELTAIKDQVEDLSVHARNGRKPISVSDPDSRQTEIRYQGESQKQNEAELTQQAEATSLYSFEHPSAACVEEARFAKLAVTDRTVVEESCEFSNLDCHVEAVPITSPRQTPSSSIFECSSAHPPRPPSTWRASSDHSFVHKG